MTASGTTLRRWTGPLRLVTAAMLVLSLATHQSAGIHAAAGLAFAAASTGHTLANGRWVRTVARRLRHGVPSRVAIDAVIAASMIVLTWVLVLTGLALLATGGGSGDHEPGHGPGSVPAAIHAPCAVLLLILVGTHVSRHRRQLRNRATAQRQRQRQRSAA